MPNAINSTYNATFQKFVDFADKAYATKGEDTVARFTGMPQGDYKGSFASFKRTADMKSANDQVRDLFLKTVAGMFGGEKFIPDLVRDNMKLEDFGKGKPLTARRIKLVATAVKMLGGGKFQDAASVGRATAMGYVASELPKLARAAHLYQQATNCTDAEAEAAALDPNSKARRLFDCGGRFTQNAENFKKGLALMDKFGGWFDNLHDDYAAGKLDTPTKRNFMAGICNRRSAVPALKFLMEEIAVNPKIPLEARNPEDVFGMKNNPAMRFVGRNYTISFANSLAQIPPERRTVLYAVFDALHKLPAGNNMPDSHAAIDQSVSAVLGARVMKNFDAVAALQKSGKLDRAHLVPILFSDLQVPANASNEEITNVFEAKLQSDEYVDIILPLHTLAMHSGATLDEAAAAIRAGTGLPNAPGISTANGHLELLDGTPKGGRDTMLGDLYRPSTPSLASNGADALRDEDTKFVFNFPDGTTVSAKKGAEDAEDVRDANNAIADKIKDLCGEVHPKQLTNVYFVLSQSGTGCNTNRAFEQYGVNSDEHMPLTFTFSRNDETGAVTIKYSEPAGFPVKFNWTTTIDVDGNLASSPMRIDHGQYDAKALAAAPRIAQLLPGKDAAAAEALVKDALAHCGDDFVLKDIVSQTMPGLCITGEAKVRTPDQIKARIDAVRANLDEARRAANGNQAIENASAWFLSGMNGKSLPAGLIARIIKASSAEKAGGFAKLAADSTPEQIAQAIADMNTAVDNTLRNAYVTDHFEGAEEMDPAREFAFTLLVAGFSKAQLQNASAALRSETTAKMFSIMDDFGTGRFRADPEQVPNNLRRWISAESQLIVEQGTRYDLALNRLLGRPEGPIIREFRGEFDKGAFGAADLLDLLVPRAGKAREQNAAKLRRDAVVTTNVQTARANAVNAYAKAGEGNAAKVDKLIKTALQYCDGNEDAAAVVASRIDTILVTNTATLRTIDQVRERVQALAANYAELKTLAKDAPALYEAGKRMMATMGGKTLPPGMIGKLVVAAANAKIDAIRKLGPRSTGADIHRAVTQLRDNLVSAMNTSGAEQEAGGPDEKGACRNFLAALMMNRCGSALRNMQGAFGGETASKLMALYLSISNGEQNDEDLSHQARIELENQGGSHMTHLGILKDAIDMAVDGQRGASIDPYRDDFDADTIDGPQILDHLINLATR
ncbi:MAG: hypothetical protein IKO01_11885 [Kiritimatiellae bacterium]|nr:hypothetical protein [Kiritimatiellia bacterium]